MTEEQFAEFKNTVIVRLNALGYSDVVDGFILKFIANKVENTIKNKTNLEQVPKELDYVFVDMVCGEFLKEKMSLGALSDNEIKGIVVKSITEGDTSITYDINSSPRALFEALVNKLITPNEEEFIKYRVMVW